MSDIKLAKRWRACVFLQEECDDRGMSSSDLAKVLKCSDDEVKNLLSGKQEMTRELSAKIGEVFGVSPLFYWNLEQEYKMAAFGICDRCGKKENGDDGELWRGIGFRSTGYKRELVCGKCYSDQIVKERELLKLEEDNEPRSIE